MLDLLAEYNNSITNILCSDIIKLFINECGNNDILMIKKSHILWSKIEKFLYKEILKKINIYNNYIEKKIYS